MRVLTWNMQGIGGLGDKSVLLESLINKGIYDVICLQEATDILERYSVREEFNGIKICTMPNPYLPRERNFDSEYTAIYYEYGENNSRCSMAIYIKSNLVDNFDLDAEVYTYPSNMKLRGMLYVKLRTGWYICNIHLISSNEERAREQLSKYIEKMNATGNKYCIFGDFNIDALTNSYIKSLEFIYTADGCTHGTGKNTKKCLDYMYSPNKIDFKASIIDVPGRYSDHSPVEYKLNLG